MVGRSECRKDEFSHRREETRRQQLAVSCWHLANSEKRFRPIGKTTRAQAVITDHYPLSTIHWFTAPSPSAAAASPPRSQLSPASPGSPDASAEWARGRPL